MADKILIDVEYVREFIGRVGGVALAVDAIPAFLSGENSEDQDVRLSSRDLGEIPHFIEAWSELCDWRDEEVTELSRILWYTARALAFALAHHTGKDEEVATDIADTVNYSARSNLEDHGLQLPDSTYYVHGDPDDKRSDLHRDPTDEPQHRNIPEE